MVKICIRLSIYIGLLLFCLYSLNIVIWLAELIVANRYSLINEIKGVMTWLGSA